DDVRGPMVLDQVIDVDHAGHAGKAGKGSSLLEETLAAPGELVGGLGRVGHDGQAIVPGGERRRQVLLDGDIAVKLAVVSKIGNAEGALTQYGADDKATNTSPGGEAHKVVRRTDSDGVIHRYFAPTLFPQPAPSKPPTKS